ncbi:MAG TPA: NAD(P)-dependent oxidoreductase [Chthoniobacterales bacterium]|nr:NAD(P)-dependent oxidoreductase [Chthoniobacterales bacterium]
MPTVFVLGGLPDVPAVLDLNNTMERGLLRLFTFNSTSDFALSGGTSLFLHYLVTEKPDAIITRPSAFPTYVESSHFDGFDHSCYLGNIGVSEREIAKVINHPKITVVRASDGGVGINDNSARSVAQVALILGALLRRPFHEAAIIPWLSGVEGSLLDAKDFRNTHMRLVNARLLKGVRWLCIGAGDQVRFLLPLLEAFEVKEAIITCRNVDPGTFERAISRMPGIRTLDDDGRGATFEDGFRVRIIQQDALTLAEGQADLLRTVDVISIHADTGRPFVDDNFLAQLTHGRTAVINLARGHVVDESAVVRALESGAIAGYASDVLDDAVEKTQDFDSSPLWRLAKSSGNDGHCILQGGSNLILLPHIGGSTQEAMDSFCSVIIPKILDRIGVAWRYAQAASAQSQQAHPFFHL